MSEHQNTLDVIMSAPNQNSEQFSARLERLTPFFAARVLNRVVSRHNSSAPLQIDMWNSFGHPMDVSYARQTQFYGADRAEYASLLIDQKYSVLEDLGIDTSCHEIVRDDDASTIDWMSEKIKALLDDGTIYEDDESVNVCAGCDNIISSASSQVAGCGRCGSANIRIERRSTLFVNLSGNRLDYIQGKIDLPRKSGFINGQFATLPGRVMIARKRDYGQPLPIPGYEDMVLDPKIGLSLMPEMVADRYNITSITQVQGATTAKNTAPYTARLSSALTARYVFTGNIPSNIDRSKVEKLGVDFFTKYLPVFMLDRSTNIDDEQLAALAVEHSRVSKKLEHAFSILGSRDSEPVENIRGAADKVHDAIGCIAMRDVRTGVLELRKYIQDELDGRFVSDLLEHNHQILIHELDNIRETLAEIF